MHGGGNVKLACFRATGQRPAQMKYRYRHSGLAVASQLELPEWVAFAADFAEPDVQIVIDDGSCPDCPSDGSTAVDGDTLRFAIDGIGGWQVEAGHTIRLHPGLGTDPRELRLFTLGSAWGALGYQRGLAMWHASAVARNDAAVLICGAAGEGKSTLAGAMLARGAVLVADDLSRVDPGVVHPSSARIKLWREAIERFGWQDRVIQRDYFRDEKFHCAAGSHMAGSDPVRLSGIVMLEEAAQVSIERIEGSEALAQVLRATLYRPETLEALGGWAQQGALAAQIVSQAPVWRLGRPKDYAVLDATCDVLETLWGE